LSTGALIAVGSEWLVGLPVLSPWLGIDGTVTRQAAADDSDDNYGDRTVNINQAVTLPQAMAVFARESAKALGIAAETGTIEPGKSADFIALRSEERRV